jgi:hypothetical protein
MAKKLDPLKAKQAKQKKIAIAGTVVLVLVLAISVPRTMKMMHRSSGPPPPPPAAVTPPAGAPTLAAPTLQGAAPTPATGTGVLATASGPSSAQTRLQSFGRFETKDPFQQQLSQDGAAPTATPAPAPVTAPAAPATSGGGGGSTPAVPTAPTAPSAPAATPSAPSAPSVPTPAPAPTSAVISVNGTLVPVTKGSDFPQPSSDEPDATPYFHLVSLTAKTAKISIAGGSYSNGAKTVTLRVNKAVTLVNTADGTRYRLVLMPQGTDAPAASAAGTTP